MTAESAPVLLDEMRSEGFALTTTPDGRLQVTPASMLTAELRRDVRRRRDELLALIATEADPVLMRAVREFVTAFAGTEVLSCKDDEHAWQRAAATKNQSHEGR